MKIYDEMIDPKRTMKANRPKRGALSILDLQEQLALGYSDDLALDPSIFIEFVDGTKPVVAIRNHHLAVLFVS